MTSTTGRLLVLCKSFAAPGGVANFVRSVMNHLPSEVQTDQLSIGRPAGKDNLFHTLATPFVDNARLIQRVLRDKPDYVHLNPSFNLLSLLRDGTFLLVLRLLRYRNVLVFFHGWDEQLADSVLNTRWKRKLVGWILGYAPVVCVLASKFKRSLVEMGLREEQVHVLTTIFDADIFAQSPAPNRAHESRAPVVTFMGRLVRSKGIFEVVEAFPAVLKQVPNARLVVAGDGAELAALQERVNQLGLSESVSFTGYITGRSKVEVLRGSDLFVFPTYYGEGCPVSLLEAMAAGLPVITGPAGGIPDIFRDGVNGVLMQEVSAPKLSGHILQLLDQPEKRQRIGRMNADYAWSHFQPHVVVGKLMDLYGATQSAR